MSRWHPCFIRQNEQIMKETTLVLNLLLFSGAAFAQNLVQNPSFENTSACPLGPSQLTNATLQAHVNYRTQCKAVSTPYETFAFSADGRLNFKKRKRNGHLLAGLNFVQRSIRRCCSNQFSRNFYAWLSLDLGSNFKIGCGHIQWIWPAIHGPQ